MPNQPGLPAQSVLSNDEIRRYSRHLLLPEVGVEGQRRLKEARVLCVGAGGLGSPASMYLAAAGVGTLGVVEFDLVDATNLQRQILYTGADTGRPKLEAAAARLAAMNAEIRIEPHAVALSSANALEILGRYDLVVDGTDNFQTRYLINDACVLLGKPNVSGSVFRFEGQVSVYATKQGPCYRCLHPEPPPPGLVPSCGEAGVLGVLPGIIGTIQAAEAIKLVTGIGEPLVGRLLVFDALKMRFREVLIAKDPACPVCGTPPRIRELADYDQLCGTTPVVLPPDLEISATELKARLDRGDAVRLVDVREPQEAIINGIPGSTVVPLGDLPGHLSGLDRSESIVVYCKAGVRSALAVHMLQAAGFGRVAHLKGGILSWIDEVDPDQPRY
jgi:sulfur-carrier protein adenylyltransferase/sulfurtransferase